MTGYGYVLPGVLGVPERPPPPQPKDTSMQRLSDVESLLSRKADVNQADSAGQHMLCVWAATCHTGESALNLGKALLAAGADIDAKSAGGYTALMAAAVKNCVPALQLLLDFGANTELKSADGRTALQHARDAMCTESYKALDEHSRATRKITILAAAKAVLPIPALVNLVLLYEMDPQIASAAGVALIQAVHDNNLTRLRAAIARGADVNCTDGFLQTPLLLAASSLNRIDVMKQLLEGKADVNMSNYNRWTPLHCCADLGESSYAKLLLQHRADANARTNKGKTPRDIAAMTTNGGGFSVMEQLKKADEYAAAADAAERELTS